MCCQKDTRVMQSVDMIDFLSQNWCIGNYNAMTVTAALLHTFNVAPDETTDKTCTL